MNNVTWNKARLLSLPPHTFGYQYADWMKERDFSSDERPVTKYVPDLELAYIMQRYREVRSLESKAVFRSMIPCMSC